MKLPSNLIKARPPPLGPCISPHWARLRARPPRSGIVHTSERRKGRERNREHGEIIVEAARRVGREAPPGFGFASALPFENQGRLEEACIRTISEVLKSDSASRFRLGLFVICCIGGDWAYLCLSQSFSEASRLKGLEFHFISCLVSRDLKLRISHARYRPASLQRGMHKSTCCRFGHICIAGAARVHVHATQGMVSASRKVTLNPSDDQTQRLNI